MHGAGANAAPASECMTASREPASCGDAAVGVKAESRSKSGHDMQHEESVRPPVVEQREKATHPNGAEQGQLKQSDTPPCIGKQAADESMTSKTTDAEHPSLPAALASLPALQMHAGKGRPINEASSTMLDSTPLTFAADTPDELEFDIDDTPVSLQQPHSQHAQQRVFKVPSARVMQSSGKQFPPPLASAQLAGQSSATSTPILLGDLIGNGPACAGAAETLLQGGELGQHCERGNEKHRSALAAEDSSLNRSVLHNVPSSDINTGDARLASSSQEASAQKAHQGMPATALHNVLLLYRWRDIISSKGCADCVCTVHTQNLNHT